MLGMNDLFSWEIGRATITPIDDNFGGNVVDFGVTSGNITSRREAAQVSNQMGRVLGSVGWAKVGDLWLPPCPERLAATSDANGTPVKFIPTQVDGGQISAEDFAEAIREGVHPVGTSGSAWYLHDIGHYMALHIAGPELYNLTRLNLTGRLSTLLRGGNMAVVMAERWDIATGGIQAWLESVYNYYGLRPALIGVNDGTNNTRFGNRKVLAVQDLVARRLKEL